MQKVQNSPSQNCRGGGALNSPKKLVLPHFKGYLSAQNIGVSREYMPTQNTPVKAKYLPLPNLTINTENFSLQNIKNLIKLFSATPCAFLC